MRSRTGLETETLALEFPTSPDMWNCPGHYCTSFHMGKREAAFQMGKSFPFIRLRGGRWDAKASQLLPLLLV